MPKKPTSAPQKNYQIVGLQPLDQMPIRFEDRVYDLANLSDEDAAYLLQFPEQVPFLRPVEASTAPTE